MLVRIATDDDISAQIVQARRWYFAVGDRPSGAARPSSAGSSP